MRTSPFLAALLVSISLPLAASAAITTGASTLDMGRAGNVAYVSGGVGDEERVALEDMERHHDYNLKLVFAIRAGNFLNGANVRISDARGGEVLNVQTTGPLFYAHLAPGSYTVQATPLDPTQGTSTITRKVSIGSTASLRTLQFAWTGSDTNVRYSVAE